VEQQNIIIQSLNSTILAYEMRDNEVGNGINEIEL
jgi:hypothetical protein